MKTILMLVAVAGLCLGAEQGKAGMFDGVDRIETVDGKVYEGVRSAKATPAYVAVMHEGGSARIPWEKMPEDLRKAYGYDRAKALEFLKAERAKEAATVAEIEKGMEIAKAGEVSGATARQREKQARDLEAKWREIGWTDGYPSAPAPAKPVFRPNATGFRYYQTPDGKGVWLREEE